MKRAYSSKKFSNNTHIIFFHGIGDNYKRAQEYVEDLVDDVKIPCTMKSSCTMKSLCNNESSEFTIIGHAHKYSTAFQNYMSYCIASSIFLGISILAPIRILALVNSLTAEIISLASLSALICIFLSISFIVLPFIQKEQSLFKSSIEKIESLIKNDVEPKNIILLGHSFGGVAASEVLKHYAERNIELGGVVFSSTFSSFEGAIRNFPIPQTKILSMLPSFILKRLLKVLNLDFNLAQDINTLYNEKKLDTPTIVINHIDDQLIPKHIQLKNAVNKDLTEVISVDKAMLDPHNDILFSSTYIKAIHNMVHNV